MVFPQTEITVKDQEKAINFPSDLWLVSRGEWDPLMIAAFSLALVPVDFVFQDVQ